MEEKLEEVEDIESASSASLIDDSDDEELSTSAQDEGLNFEAPFTEEEIEELIADLMEVESKAAEAQESLEEEALAKVEAEVLEELGQSLKGHDLEKAVADEMTTYKEEWEAVLDELETDSARLLEQLDGAGIELPSLYKWIESQAPNGCCTEAWKKRSHWVGSQMTSDITESIDDAEKYLQLHRPVRRRHGRVLEEGASGFLGKKLTIHDNEAASTEKADVDWCSFNKIFSTDSSVDGISFGSKNWASVYLASTPQQAADLGLNFPGVDEVEEIDNIEDCTTDPFVAAAIANERELFSEEQKKKLKKIKEEDDANVDQKLRFRLKQRRHRNRCKKEDTQKEVSSNDGLMENILDAAITSNVNSQLSVGGGITDQNLKTNVHTGIESSNDYDMTASKDKCLAAKVFGTASSDLIEPRGTKRLLGSGEVTIDSKKSRNDTMNGCEEANFAEYASSLTGNIDCALHINEDGFVPSQSVSENFQCTACGKVVIEVHSHPLLKVIICEDCKSLIQAKIDLKDSDCVECYCGWCGQNGDLVSCRSCKMLFCSTCIRRNLGEECLVKIQASGWRCCSCSPSVLQQLTSQLERAIESRCLLLSRSNSSDSSYSDEDEDANVVVGTKRRRKKKIRRILDDAELGEETRRKIAIEKERQERLKSLEAQVSNKTVMMSSASFIGNMPEGGSVELLGDALTGYIVNVVREEGEEAVRIPPSISAKLKPHQIAGIRFMWENIIQSLRKVKSGDKGLGCILAHTMGLGKTFQVIAFLYAALRCVDLGLRTALIVTPVSVLHNWRHEFMKWRPSELKPLRVFMLEDVPRERRAELLTKWKVKGGVFLIGYTAFRNLSLGKHIKDRDLAKRLCHSLQDGPDILVCDEAHMIKNTRADVTQALKQVKCQRRIALTGSPLQNNLMEYYCMVDFVREGFLGSSHEFRNRFQNPIENGQHTNSTFDDVKIMNQRSHILYEQLKGFVQRMDMNVVKNDLPPKTVFVMAVKLSPLQRKLYKRFLDVHGFTKDKISGEKIQKRCFWAGYQALAQIWNHPGILQLMKEDKDHGKREDAVENFLADVSSSDDDCNIFTGEKVMNKNEFPQRKNVNTFLHEGWWNDLLLEKNYKEVDHSGKMVLLIDILTMCCDVGDKALVFSQSLSTLDLIELYLSRLPRSGKKGKCWKQGKDWFRLDGRTGSLERQKLVESFNDPFNRRVKCILISTRAGSLGINMHAANRVIIVDGSWNPTYDLQAIYRAWRYGQTKPVFAYRLMAHGTMEEKIYKRQVTKEGLAARVVDRQQVHRTISKEEMLHLFDFGDDDNSDAFPEESQGNVHMTKQSAAPQVGNFLKQKLPLSHGSFSSDKLMESLLGRHYPRWIANYHEHETLLQENEEEKLSKEEQDLAWEVFLKSLEVSPVDSSLFDWKPLQHISLDESRDEPVPVALSNPLHVPDGSDLKPPKGRLRNRSMMQRKCTNLSHLLTLRSQGTKAGCSTVCGECAQEISWEDLNREGRPR